MQSANASHRLENTAQSAEVQNWAAWVKAGINRVTSWTKSGVQVIAPLVVAAMPDHIADDHHHAATPHHAEQQERHGGKNNDHHADVQLSPGDLAKLANDEAAHKEISRIGFRRYFDNLHAKEPVVVEEKKVVKLFLRCVDERQAGKDVEPYTDKEGHSIAGVCILATDDELRGMARDSVGIAKTKSEERNEVVKIVVQYHKKCGAAGLSLEGWNSKKKDSEKETGPDAVDRHAELGAQRTKAALLKAIDELGAKGKVEVDVKQFDEKNFSDNPNHPGSIIFINRCKGKVATMSTKNGPYWYNVTGNIGTKAEFNAILSATIAEGKHGRFAGSKAAPKDRPLYFGFAVDSEEEGEQSKADMEAALRKHEQFGPMLRAGKVKVEYWVPDHPAVEPKNVQPAPKSKAAAFLPEQFAPNRKMRRLLASEERRAREGTIAS